MYRFKTFIKEDFLKEEDEGEKLKHIEHVEDHPINDGAAGFDHAVGVLTKAHHHIISGSKDASLTMKHDGSPSIVFGHHPDTGKFFVASKSAFNKEPKINYNAKDVQKNHGHAPGLVEKLNHALEHLPKIVPKKGVFQGDVLFSGKDKKREGDKYTFTPNTIKYSADSDTEDGKKIKKAKFGLYTHTEYIGQNAKAMNAHFDPDLSGFSHHDDVYHREPGHDTSKVKMQDADHKDFEGHLAAAQKIHDKHKDTMYDAVGPVKDHFKTYINQTVRTGETPSTEGLQKHVEDKYQKDIDKVKTDKAKDKKKAELNALTKHILMHKGHLDNVFKLHHHLTQAKNTLVRVLSQHTGGLDHEVNDHSVKPEGFVVTHEGKVSKLNDRNEFNRLNFLKSQNKKTGSTNESADATPDYKTLKPAHSFKTDDGHHIDVHFQDNPNGKHAVFFNRHLNAVTKLVHWNHGAKTPSAEELEQAGSEDHKQHHLNEEYHFLEKLFEKAPIVTVKQTKTYKDLDPDSAGKIVEHSTVVHLHNHVHKQNGTFGTPEHKAAIAPHEKEIKKLGSGAYPDQVELRREHGKAAAAAILEQTKLKHGKKAKIIRVGHTAKEGDIPEFTRGKHLDTQVNPSDVALHIRNSSRATPDDKDQYEGHSLKSSKKSSQITVKNPAIHMYGTLDHPSRTMNTEKISQDGLKNLRKDMGYANLTPADAGRMISAARQDKKKDIKYTPPKDIAVKKTKVETNLERKANDLGRKVKVDVATEFHDHVHHLLHNVGEEGHHMISNMLRQHLSPETSMPVSKVHVKGNTPDRVHATVTSISDSPLHDILSNPKSRYAVKRSGERVTISHVDKDGNHVPLAHYAPKTKSNAFKSGVHGWNVVPANINSKSKAKTEE